eukprot:COSAG01_NODE_2193_length_8183_cov_3.620609_2_plen_82_part_00
MMCGAVYSLSSRAVHMAHGTWVRTRDGFWVHSLATYSSVCVAQSLHLPTPTPTPTASSGWGLLYELVQSIVLVDLGGDVYC